MGGTLGSASLTDLEVDALAWEFLNSAYAAETYADWSLDRRLDGFLLRSGLDRVVQDGDAYDLLLSQVMAHIGAVSHPVLRRQSTRRR
jgi:hypothetical protein